MSKLETIHRIERQYEFVRSGKLREEEGHLLTRERDSLINSIIESMTPDEKAEYYKNLIDSLKEIEQEKVLEDV